MEISMTELVALVGRAAPPHGLPDHPLIGRRVLAVLPHGFIHFGTLNRESGVLKLTDAKNLRYWVKRDGGLPEFARSGTKGDDRIDPIGTVYLENVLFFYPLGDWA